MTWVSIVFDHFHRDGRECAGKSSGLLGSVFYRLGGGGGASRGKTVVAWVSIVFDFVGHLATSGVEGRRGGGLFVTSDGRLLLLGNGGVHGLLLLVR